MQTQAQGNSLSTPIDVTVSRISTDNQSLVEVHARAFAHATPQQVWQVLTDYDRLHEFVPNLLLSKLIGRNGLEAIVEQHGYVGFLFLIRIIDLVIRVTEQPFTAIEMSRISGNLKQYVAYWELAPTRQNGVSGTHIVYAATLEPDFLMPPFFGTLLVQADIKDMLRAVLDEIGRRWPDT